MSTPTLPPCEQPYASRIDIYPGYFRAYVQHGHIRHGVGRFTTEREATDAIAAKVEQLKRQAEAVRRELFGDDE